MAVQSNTFGGLRLSGEEAKKFRNQVRVSKPSAAAKATAARGVSAARELISSGKFVLVKNS